MGSDPARQIPAEWGQTPFLDLGGRLTLPYD
jgi:hypothetical protein